MSAPTAAENQWPGPGGSKRLKYAVTYPQIGVPNKNQDRPGREVSVLECFVVKALMLFDKVQAV
jgi:hypothetical protein